MAIVLTLFASGVAFAQAKDDASQVLKGSAAFGDWHQDKPGVKRLLTPHDLPATSAPTYGAAEIVPMPAGAKPAAPPGFSVERVTSGLANPRAIRVAPNGDLFVADSMSNTVRIYRVPEGSAKPSKDEVFASGLRQPFGIAFYPPGVSDKQVWGRSVGVAVAKDGSLFVTEDGNGTIWRVSYQRAASR